ncbi:6-phosphogluconate dehydrogenase [Sphingobium faniae]|nr:6-phosphogluconate dehydrogenase [Sphingobium faniae]
MQIAMIGLGRMGSNMARRLMRGGHDVVVYDVDAAARARLVAEGAVAVETLEALAEALVPPRSVWVMVPAGDVTENTIASLTSILSPGDTVIDGGNSHYKNTIARSEKLAEYGVAMLDVGTSGGVFGLDRGYCLMIGGTDEVAARHAPIFDTLAPGSGDVERTPARLAKGAAEGSCEDGWLHCGRSGSGHYVKMVHNGIEYGMMQAFAEGFALFESAGDPGLPENRRFDLDCAAIAELWRRGSVVSSWLLDLTADALAENPTLDGFSSQVQDSGEGRWTVEAAIEQAVPAHVLTAALFARFRSRQVDAFGDRVLSAMRFKFGGHVAPTPAKTDEKIVAPAL